MVTMTRTRCINDEVYVSKLLGEQIIKSQMQDHLSHLSTASEFNTAEMPSLLHLPGESTPKEPGHMLAVKPEGGT